MKIIKGKDGTSSSIRVLKGSQNQLVDNRDKSKDDFNNNRSLKLAKIVVDCEKLSTEFLQNKINMVELVSSYLNSMIAKKKDHRVPYGI